ncbi:MAG: hypothetical protein ABIP54_04720, partial [Candidatus Andersenbacteria bacterium]
DVRLSTHWPSAVDGRDDLTIVLGWIGPHVDELPRVIKLTFRDIDQLLSYARTLLLSTKCDNERSRILTFPLEHVHVGDTQSGIPEHPEHVSARDELRSFLAKHLATGVRSRANCLCRSTRPLRITGVIGIKLLVVPTFHLDPGGFKCSDPIRIH